MHERRRALSSAERRRAGEAVARGLGATPELARARRIALYAAAGGELPTEPLLAEALARELPVLWPRVRGDALEFARCAADALEPGAFGIPAPPASAPATELGEGDLVVLPMLAVDLSGRRLGRGGGHYDRAFAAARAHGPLLAAVGYDFQVVGEVPAGEGDGRVDMVVTERRCVRTRAGGGAR